MKKWLVFLLARLCRFAGCQPHGCCPRPTRRVFVVGPLVGALLSVPAYFATSQPWEARKVKVSSSGKLVVEDEEANVNKIAS